jgi:hypothetical protein
MSQNTSKHRSYEDADTMAGNAMHGRSQHLAPSRRNISFVQSGERLATAKYVEKPAYHAGICRQQHEAPFEDRRFRRIADVNGDEQQSSRREDKPQQRHAVQHRGLPGVGCTAFINSRPRPRSLDRQPRQASYLDLVAADPRGRDNRAKDPEWECRINVVLVTAAKLGDQGSRNSPSMQSTQSIFLITGDACGRLSARGISLERLL